MQIFDHYTKMQMGSSLGGDGLLIAVSMFTDQKTLSIGKELFFKTELETIRVKKNGISGN